MKNPIDRKRLESVVLWEAIPGYRRYNAKQPDTFPGGGVGHTESPEPERYKVKD